MTNQLPNQLTSKMTGHNNFLHHVDMMLNINTTKQPPSNHDPRILIDPPDHSS